MSKFHCPICCQDFQMNYWKWILISPFHWLGKRLTKCPLCGSKSWIRRVK